MHDRRLFSPRPRPSNRSRYSSFAVLLVSYLATVIGSATPAGTRAPAEKAPDTARTSTYDVAAGKTSLKMIAGERVLELSDGVTIVHEDVVVTSRSGYHYSDQKLTLLSGDVVVRQGTLTMSGNEGEYRQPQDLAVMTENVRVVDRGWEVTCREGRYSRATGHAWLVGDIVAKDSTTTLTADSMFYDRNAELAEVFGRVRITNADEGFTALGKHGYYYRGRREGVIDRSPRLIVEPESPEPVTIESDTMRVFPDDRRALAYYTVKIIKGNTVTQCDSAALFDGQSRAELYGRPLARQERVSMEGEAMALHYDDKEVRRIDINGGARIREAQADTLVIGRDNWIQGDTLSLYLTANRVDSVGVLHNAVSEYFPSSPNKIENNVVRGDQMFFRFREDSLRYIRITGNASGVYKFLDLRRGETADSLRALLDTSLTYRSFAKEAEDVVYSARRIEYMADSKDLVLKDSAKIRYQDRLLSGDEVTYFSSIQMLDARGDPKLVDAGQEFFGERMDYDLDAEAGVVNQGSTKFEQGYYRGENVAKVGENEMKVWGSRYTTCELKVPHYYIKAPHMKVYPKDKAVSGSTVLYVGETPIFYLPFIANSIRTGRRSGFLRPDFEFGITKSTGRYIRNVGYFWATNDYTDFTFLGDFNEDQSFRTHVRNRYKLRYLFEGSVEGDFYRDLSENLNEWSIGAVHTQTLGDRFTVASDLHFVSSDRAPQAISRIDDVNRVIDRSLRSNVSVRKSWDAVGFSASATRMQNLNMTDPNGIRVQMTFPSVTLSIPSRNLYFGEPSQSGRGSVWEKLLTGIRYSPSVSGSRVTEEREFQYIEVVRSQQSLSFQSPQKLAFLTISPTLSASNTYARTVTEIEAHEVDTVQVAQSRVVVDDDVFAWNFGARASTNFYGTFSPHVGSLRGIRHTLSPSAGYSYAPSVEGRPRSQGVSVSLANTIDLKTASGAEQKASAGGPQDTTEAGGSPPAGEETLQKIPGFIIWTLSSQYNPDRPAGTNWSNVQSSVNLRVFGTSLSVSQTIDPYEWDVLSTSAQTQISLNGTHPFGRSEKTEVRELNVVAAADTAREEGVVGEQSSPLSGQAGGEAPGPGEAALEKGGLPWNLFLAISYNKQSDQASRATADVSGQIEFTRNWRISYWTSYDFADRIFRGQNFTVHRDLHCWEMSLSRQLLGDEWQFYFRISLKAHPELYTETGQRGLGGSTSALTSGSLFQ